MAADEGGLIVALKEWWPLVAAAVTGVAGYAGAKKQLEARVASLEADRDIHEQDRHRATERHESLQRLVGDTVTAVAEIRVAVRSLDALPNMMSDLRAALAEMRGKMHGRD